MMEQGTSETSTGQGVFVGKRWGSRGTVILLYWTVLYMIALWTADVSFPGAIIVLLLALAIALVLFFFRESMRRWFRHTYLMYGFFSLVFLFIGYSGMAKKGQNERLLSQYMQSAEVKAKQTEIQRRVGSGEMPYSSYDEAKVFLFREFPKAATYAQEIWLGQVIGGTSSYLLWPTVVAYLLSLIQYKRRARSESRLIESGETTEEIEPAVSVADENASITESDMSSSLAKADSTSDTGLFCPHCGKSTLLEQRYCSKCGKRIAPLQCPNCDQELAIEDRFCPRCGMAFPENSELSQ